MNSTLLDLSKKVDPSIVDGVAAVSTAAQRLRISFLIVGAAARDFLLECACGIISGRATLDVDFGVRVNSWEEYEKLAKELEDSEGGCSRYENMASIPSPQLPTYRSRTFRTHLWNHSPDYLAAGR